MNATASEFAARREGYGRMREAVSQYGISPGTLVRAGSGYRVDGPAGPYFLKRFAFSPAEARLMYEILEHLRAAGMGQVPRVRLTQEGQPFAAPGGDIFYLQEWHDLAAADLADPATLAAATDLLSELHLAGRGFRPSAETAGVRDDYGSWLPRCISRLRDMYSFAELAEDHRKESRFDARYAKASLAFSRHAEEAVRRLAELPLGRLAEREREAGAVCHRNFSPRNLALDGGSRLRALDFDHAGPEIRLVDLAKFVRRAGAMDPDRTAFILERYSQGTGLALGETELGLLSAHLLFPAEFWAVGNSRFRKNHRRERALAKVLDQGEAWAAYANAVRHLRLPPAQEGPVLPSGPPPPELGLELPEPAGLPRMDLSMTSLPPAAPLALARIDIAAMDRRWEEKSMHQWEAEVARYLACRDAELVEVAAAEVEPVEVAAAHVEPVEVAAAEVEPVEPAGPAVPWDRTGEPAPRPATIVWGRWPTAKPRTPASREPQEPHP